MNVSEIYKLAQQFEESISDVYYHGGREISNIQDLSFDRKRGSQDLNQEGPGFYLTSSFDEAKTYGDVIYKTIIPSDFVFINNVKPKLKILLDFYKLSSDVNKEIFLSNWGENVSPQKVIKDNYLFDSLHDCFVSFYTDLLQYSSKSYIDIIKKLGFDGYLVDKNNSKHIVVYNIDKLNLERVE